MQITYVWQLPKPYEGYWLGKTNGCILDAYLFLGFSNNIIAAI